MRCPVCASLSSLFNHWMTCWLDRRSSWASASCWRQLPWLSSARCFSAVNSASCARNSLHARPEASASCCFCATWSCCCCKTAIFSLSLPRSARHSVCNVLMISFPLVISAADAFSFSWSFEIVSLYNSSAASCWRFASWAASKCAAVLARSWSLSRIDCASALSSTSLALAALSKVCLLEESAEFSSRNVLFCCRSSVASCSTLSSRLERSRSCSSNSCCAAVICATRVSAAACASLAAAIAAECFSVSVARSWSVLSA
mmetsp:Transcript_66613/g.148675  ORF Transcript_66613/g.148675 Transcript_66613/m.148675 type:complete len:260 (-) Transcript_66613:695-1474(-)